MRSFYFVQEAHCRKNVKFEVRDKVQVVFSTILCYCLYDFGQVLKLPEPKFLQL